MVFLRSGALGLAALLCFVSVNVLPDGTATYGALAIGAALFVSFAWVIGRDAARYVGRSTVHVGTRRRRVTRSSIFAAALIVIAVAAYFGFTRQEPLAAVIVLAVSAVLLLTEMNDRASD